MPRVLIGTLAFVAFAAAIKAPPAARRIAVETGEGLEFVHLVPKTVDYKGQKALQLVAAANTGQSLALLKDLEFKDGTIEVDLAGLPGPGASDTARGFIGVAFRSAPHATAFDCFYLRPTNGRADDQLRRNHATQYVSEPDYPWERLRTQSPGVYESYVDLETGAWTHVRIEVSGVHARLFVNGAAQPALIVNDLKRGVTSGAIGLWIGPGTEAYFRNLHVTTP
jgi:hypothetical protein